MPEDYNIIDRYNSPSYDSTYIKLKYKDKSIRSIVQQVIRKDSYNENIYIEDPYTAHTFIHNDIQVISKAKDGYVIQDPINNQLGTVIYIDTIQNIVVYSNKFHGKILIHESPLKISEITK